MVTRRDRIVRAALLIRCLLLWIRRPEPVIDVFRVATIPGPTQGGAATKASMTPYR